MALLGNPHVRLYLGAALISVSPVWVALVSVSPTTSGFYRVFFGSLALIAYLAVTRRKFDLSKRAWKILMVAATFFALDLFFWHRSIVYIGPGLSTLLANFQVFVMIIAGMVLLRQKPRPVQLVAAPLALLGLGLIIGFDWQALPGDYRLGIAYGLATAVVYAGYLLSMRAAREGSPYLMPTREVAIVSIVCAVMLGITAVAEGDSLAITTASDAMLLVGYGVLSHCLGLILIASGLPHVSAAEAGLALLLQPTLSFIWDVLFFARGITATELVGAALALTAIYLGSRRATV